MPDPHVLSMVPDFDTTRVTPAGADATAAKAGVAMTRERPMMAVAKAKTPPVKGRDRPTRRRSDRMVGSVGFIVVLSLWFQVVGLQAGRRTERRRAGADRDRSAGGRGRVDPRGSRSG